MENQYLYKNYTEEQMDHFAHAINQIILAFKGAQDAKTTQLKGFHLNVACIHIQELPKDGELVEFILKNVFDSPELQTMWVIGGINFINIIFMSTFKETNGQ